MRDALINVLISIASLAVVTGIGYLFTASRKNLNPDDKIYKFSMVIENIISQAIRCTNQVFVDELKKNGNFDDEARKKAYDITKKYVEDMITDKSKKFIENTYGNLDTYLKTKIEEGVAASKTFNISAYSPDSISTSDNNTSDDVKKYRLNYIDNFRYETDEDYEFKDTVFTTKNRTRMSQNSLSNLIKKRCREAGISEDRVKLIAPHRLRATYITSLVEKGLHITIIKQLARHKSINATVRYTGMELDLAKDVANELLNDYYNSFNLQEVV